MRADWSLHRAGGVAILFAAAFLAASGQALADDPPAPLPPTSAIDQYIESVPTAGGDVANGVGKKRSKALPRSVGTLIESQGGADAAALKAIASDSTYGAPQKRIAPKRAVPRREAPESSGALSAAAVATGSSGSHAFWLLGILAVTTVAAFVAAGLRQRARR